MRILTLVALLTAIGTGASAQDVVAGFVGDTVTAFDEASSIEGRSIETCAFALPTPVLERSQGLRVRIDSPEGPVWVSSSEAIIAGLDELPRPFESASGDVAMAGGTRGVTGGDGPADDSRSLPVPESETPGETGIDASPVPPGCPAAPAEAED